MSIYFNDVVLYGCLVGLVFLFFMLVYSLCKTRDENVRPAENERIEMNSFA